VSEQDQAQERTERPSPRRLEKARKQGQVARSRELNTVAVILAGGSCFVFLGSWAMRRLSDVLSGGLANADYLIRNPDSVMSLVRSGVIDTLTLLTPVMIGALIAALAGPVVLGGFTFSAEALQPKLSRLSPSQGMKRIVSAQGLMELVKTVLKFAVLTGLAIALLWSLSDEILGLGVGTAAASIAHAGDILRRAFLVVATGLLLIAAIDVPFVLWNHLRRLRMTRQELRDEHKETEGSPETRARIRRVRQELASRRMLQDVPVADVVLINPTHYAVALCYTDRPDRAPRVVAKGSGHIAARIREIASAHEVPVCEAPLLTRAIYFNTELGDDIPTGLYLAVARVLVWVMNVRTAQKSSARPPEFPTDLPVPPELKTESEVGA
jgi:flagellar biosynthetic protein FlhB